MVDFRGVLRTLLHEIVFAGEHEKSVVFRSFTYGKMHFWGVQNKLNFRVKKGRILTKKGVTPGSNPRIWPKSGVASPPFGGRPPPKRGPSRGPGVPKDIIGGRRPPKRSGPKYYAGLSCKAPDLLNPRKSTWDTFLHSNYEFWGQK